MAIEKINHEELAISRLATQFKEAVNLIAYLKALVSESDVLEQVFCDLIEKRTIDTATKVNLDIIGSIVGQSRVFIDAEIFHYFGFAPHPQSNSFGDLDDPGVGGRWRKIGESTTGIRYLTDEEYRLFIRARILRNYTRSTIQDIVTSIRFIFDDIFVVLRQQGIAAYTLSFGRPLTLNEKAILQYTDIVPETAGVQVSYVTEFDQFNFFAFGGLTSPGIPNARGLGSLIGVAGGLFGSLVFNL